MMRATHFICSITREMQDYRYHPQRRKHASDDFDLRRWSARALKLMMETPNIHIGENITPLDITARSASFPFNTPMIFINYAGNFWQSPHAII